jgi:1-acyl-sn-glycerol-3-phosphate acyltransferase
VLRAFRASLVLSLYTAGFGVFCIVLGLVDGSGGRANAIIRAWSRALLRAFGVRVNVSGRQNLPAGPAVYAVNHVSAGDIPVLFAHLPVDFRIIYKRSLSFVPVVGWCLTAARHIAIDRANPFRARRSLEAAAARIRAGTSVVVFPEGTRSRAAGVGPFKRGSFTLAIQARVPVVPVSLAGMEDVMPRGLKSLRKGSVALRILAALPTEGRRAEEAESLAEDTRRAVIRGLEEAPA